jgi:hypothetical protein
MPERDQLVNSAAGKVRTCARWLFRKPSRIAAVALLVWFLITLSITYLCRHDYLPIGWMPSSEQFVLIGTLWKAWCLWWMVEAIIQQGRKRRAQRWAEKAAAKENFQHQVEEFARKSIEDSRS